MEKHKTYTITHKTPRTWRRNQPPFDTHDNGRASCYILDERDSGIEQTAIHDAQVSGKADRYSARIGLRLIELKFQQ